MSEATWAIEARNIQKRYGRIEALRGVSVRVPAGSVFSVLGPNGAGKTTLLKILTTITRPDEGEVRILGMDIRQQPTEVRNRIGIVSQENHFETYFSIWDNLTLHAEMHGLSKAEYTPRIEELLSRVGLSDRREARSDELSGGMQRRISLIRALIHQPAVLFLDEPTTGLDPIARREIWEAIVEFKQNATVVLTTHYMEEADVLSDQIMMIHCGEVVMTGTPRELKQAITPQNRYELILKVPKAEAYRGRISPYASDIRIPDAYRLQMNLNSPDDLPRIFNALDYQDLLRLGVLESDLEEVFLSVARRENHDSPEAACG